MDWGDWTVGEKRHLHTTEGRRAGLFDCVCLVVITAVGLPVGAMVLTGLIRG